jgi:hypothetical protein
VAQLILIRRKVDIIGFGKSRSYICLIISVSVAGLNPARLNINKETLNGVSFYLEGDVMPKSSKCWHYKHIAIAEPANCPNCQHWNGKKCKDEAIILAEWEKKHGAYVRMMRDNKGVSI